MKDLVLLMAGIMPEEMLVEELEEFIRKYKINPTKENFKSLMVPCTLICSKVVLNGKSEDPIQAIVELEKEFDKIEHSRNLLIKDNQKQ